jgi:hypothetical protein
MFFFFALNLLVHDLTDAIFPVAGDVSFNNVVNLLHCLEKKKVVNLSLQEVP